MSLILYGHPLSSYTHKVLIALHELGAGFTFHEIDPGSGADRALMASMTPLGKMPALRDEANGATLAETSVIIEWLDRHHPGTAPLLPREPDAALQARLWDRFFDIHVMNVTQQIVDARLFMPDGTVEAVTPWTHSQIDRAYRAAEAQLAGRDWIAGDFGLADCAAVPALFYTGFLRPFDAYPNLAAYFERLLARASVARVLDGARPWLHLFPFADRIPARFR